MKARKLFKKYWWILLVLILLIYPIYSLINGYSIYDKIYASNRDIRDYSTYDDRQSLKCIKCEIETRFGIIKVQGNTKGECQSLFDNFKEIFKDQKEYHPDSIRYFDKFICIEIER